MSASAIAYGLLGLPVGYVVRYVHEWVLDATYRPPLVRNPPPIATTVSEHTSPPQEAEPSSSVPQPRGLIITRRCPHGYSAKQILGHNYFGTIHPPQYPGGIEAWKEAH